ncbi:penicillin-binding transpeptidase domain-containing protein [Clostridium sp. CF011]|uniref:penicillin-binding transpeptidase domain-containing protein n=1 Tax=Clostridium sp. CF011 TaxID=2843318 RepID=UPI001C0D062C|nr:penicillin-binding transpeptidase domain-containing protein [Clostridium sp. CF011]MBU3093074.1 penicillin-binding transpeptidase domain-containing protein [Clostridium sp. CF011]WAG71152.1 penicillin-binding transpeptidase domain-containing protein [Clostridium sp. CF011]
MKNKFLNGRFYRCKKLVLVILVIVTLVSGIYFLWWNKTKTISANKYFDSYVNSWKKKDFALMYNMIDAESRKKISEADFVQRYKNIYSGIELKEIDVKIKDSEKKKYDSSIESVKFEVIMDTIAGKLTFDNTGELIKDSKNKTWKILWSSKMIFPELENEDKIRVATLYAKRGEIKDKNDKSLALDGTVAEIDIIPEKLGNDAAKSKGNVSKILQVSLEDINKKLSATYVKPDMFIPIKTISEDETEKISALLEIPGVMVNEKKARVYPLKEKAAHLIGYIQAISAEEIEKNKEEGYRKDDIIGKTGLEKIYEKTLRGKNGYEIYVVDKNNKKKKSLISKAVQNGEDLKLTIDADMQSLLYDELSKDAGTSVAMNPKTGEVLALVSTPSYDPNNFVMGMSQDLWKSLNEDKKKPLYNRFQSNLCPGSVFKPVIAAIGLKTKKIDAEISKNILGLRWQKDKSFGNYFVTRVVDYGQPSDLRNAFIHSDNIYFAQAALDIGKDTLQAELKEFGLGEKIPFEYGLSKSQFDADGDIKGEVQLADSGYGQGEVLINPLHLAAIYSSFVNKGSMIKPYIKYNGTAKSEMWKSNVFTEEVASTILKDLTQVVENPRGTGHQAYIKGLSLAGKTGTAEIKLSQDDVNGTELGWFAAVNTDSPDLLVIAMAEDVKERGGSHYVVPMVRKVFEKFHPVK